MLSREIGFCVTSVPVVVDFYGDAMYVSFYERLLKQQKKRKLDAAEIVDADAAVAIQDENEE